MCLCVQITVFLLKLFRNDTFSKTIFPPSKVSLLIIGYCNSVSGLKVEDSLTFLVIYLFAYIQQSYVCMLSVEVEPGDD